MPVTGFEVNFSPMPRIAPPPLGKLIAGAETGLLGFPPPAFESAEGSFGVNTQGSDSEYASGVLIFQENLDNLLANGHLSHDADQSGWLY